MLRTKSTARYAINNHTRTLRSNDPTVLTGAIQRGDLNEVALLGPYFLADEFQDRGEYFCNLAVEHLHPEILEFLVNSCGYEVTPVTMKIAKQKDSTVCVQFLRSKVDE